MSKHHVTTTINGEPTEFLCEPQLTLLDVLRDELRLTGSKEGCSSGDCGACSVTIDGRLVCSCLVLAVEAEGKSIQTVEGMARGNDLHPLQQKFLEHAALQCGFCTPGVLVASKALLERNPDPTETEVRYWLAGNLCRCTGYDKIVRAVLDTAAEMRGDPDPTETEVRYWLAGNLCRCTGYDKIVRAGWTPPPRCAERRTPSSSRRARDTAPASGCDNCRR